MKEIKTSGPKKPEITPEEAKRKDKIKTYIIYGIIAAALIIYLIVTAIPPADETHDNTLPDTPVQTTSVTISTNPPVEDISPETDVSDDFLSTPETTDPDDNYTIPSSEHVLLMADDDIAACYVYIPLGFEASVYPRSISIKPEDFNTSVTGNKPITINWSSILFFDELKETKYYDDNHSSKYKKDAYEIIHEYDFVAHENAIKRVYIIKHEQLVVDEYKDQLNDLLMYTIVIDIENNGLYPCFKISNENLKRLTTKRYPDLIALTEALFMPVLSDNYAADSDSETTTTTETSDGTAFDATILPVTD